ncbi:MAG: hypothetical protein M1831_002808 [Alyxoria varia]|nr:MAG: hypothetical protein M1831_002808 [Alyxoria varia]
MIVAEDLGGHTQEPAITPAPENVQGPEVTEKHGSRNEARQDKREPTTKTRGLSSLMAGAALGGAAIGEDDDKESAFSTQSGHSKGRSITQYRNDARVERDTTSHSTPYPSTDFMPTSPIEEQAPFSAMPFPAPTSKAPAYPPDYPQGRESRETKASVSFPDEPIAETAPPISRGVSFSEEKSSKQRKGSEDGKQRGRSPRPNGRNLSINTEQVRAPSPGASSQMNRLSVGNSKADTGSGKAPPASPLLEAYRGTYQSMSPMPSPIMMPEAANGDVPPLSPLSGNESTVERTKTGKIKKRVKLYDAEGDAEKLASALNHHEARPGPLIDILPELTHDQLFQLRNEYKRLVKVGDRGVNLSKQIKAATTGNFRKICYVTSLGRWESEAYWANFWYQSHSSSRELLIEALMGRTNADIREIKDGFSDKRYYDDLSRCMEKELKPDKFRSAVLLALEAHRQEETDVKPVEYRERDCETLHRALRSREGGESAILEIVILRSANHLREVLKMFERTYKANFAKEALRKSNNLVGEVIAHILNGIINRPSRDCMLLRHAVNDITNKDVDLRYELLLSRLVRLHWDKVHLSRVKEEYKSKYQSSLERDVKDALRGDFQRFCLRLCES